MARRYELTTSEWNRIKDYLPPERSGQKGRPRKDNRTMLNGIVWILRTGCQWRELPECYGSWQSVYSRFRKWQKDGIFELMQEAWTNSFRNCCWCHRRACKDFGNGRIFFFCCPYFVLVFMLQSFRSFCFFYPNPFTYIVMKAFLTYSFWRFSLFSFSIQCNTLLFIFITVLH